MDAFVALIALGLMVAVWVWLARTMRSKGKGKGWFVRHIAGSFAGVFVGLLTVALAIEAGLIAPASEEEASIAYTITKDENRNGHIRKVEVLLPRRLSTPELAEVAAAVKAVDSGAEKTFIGFRIDGQNAGAYWANAQFDPDYQGRLIGLSSEDYQKLQSLDLTGYPDMQGHWLADGALGHVKVLYQRDGAYFIDSVFASGGKNTEQYQAQKLADGTLRLELLESDFGEYYLVQVDGSLEGWGQNGRYLSLPKRG